MKKKYLLLVSILIILAIFLVGCQSMEDEAKIRIGCMAITESIIDSVIDDMEKDGFQIEKVVFDGAHLPATSLDDGSIDGFVLNHLQWVEVYNEKNDANLKMVEPYIYYFRNGVYSSKYDKIEDLPEGSVVAIPGDPDNMDRSLRTLEKIGLIKLGPDKDLYNLTDVEHNYKNIEIVETEITSTVKSLHDVDLIISGANAMRLAGEDYEANLFIDDEVDSKYPISLTVRDGDEEKNWVKSFMSAVNTDEFKKEFNETYKGTFILYEDLD